MATPLGIWNNGTTVLLNKIRRSPVYTLQHNVIVIKLAVLIINAAENYSR